MTELIFNGVFNDLSVPQTVALLSCFVCDEKSNEIPAKTSELAGPLRKMQVYNSYWLCLKLITSAHSIYFYFSIIGLLV